jgi:hypothetical protein
MGDIDWRVLRGSLIVLVVALGISGALIYGGYQVAIEAELTHKRDKNRFHAARKRYLTLDDEDRIIKEFAPQYVALEQAGLIGDERRLSWIETLRKVAKGMKMPSLRYEITSQEKLKPQFKVPGGVFGVYSTEMRLRMGLLHAADLPAVFAALTEAAQGLFTVTGCSMTREYSDLSANIDPSVANVEVTCRLSWMVTRKARPKV